MKIARDLGLDAYRISISWPRILPGDVYVAKHSDNKGS